MRGHRFASAARSLIEVVRLSVYLPRNVRVELQLRSRDRQIRHLESLGVFAI
jgi:hypothetical protein